MNETIYCRVSLMFADGTVYNISRIDFDDIAQTIKELEYSFESEMVDICITRVH